MSWLAICLSVITVFSATAGGLVHPSIHWKKMRFDHFELVYDSQHQDLAEIYAFRIKKSIEKLSPLFPEIPEKTTFVLSDQTDLTNGYAGVFPYPMVMIFPVLPAPSETVSEFGDWEYEITLHEYAHILAMYAKRGVVRGLNKVFGSIIVPNMLLPRWWHEGLAVELETHFSNHGRLRSSLQEAWIRALVLENKLQSVPIADINEVSNPDWPYGARPYFYGSLIWSKMINQYGLSLISKLTHRYGGRLPYMINSPAEDELQQNYENYFRETLTEIQAKAEKQISLISNTHFKSENVELPFREIFSPRLSPDGLKLAFVAKDETQRRSVEILVRSSKDEPFQAKHLIRGLQASTGEVSTEMKAPVPRHREGDDGPPAGAITRLSWFPDSEKLVFDKVDSPDRYTETSDLWIYNLKSAKAERVGKNLRAREPSVSPDGKKIAYVHVQAGKTNLAIYDLEKQVVDISYSAKLQTRVSSPIFLPHNEVLFSLRENGTEKLMLKKISDPSVVLEQKTNLGLPIVYIPHHKKILYSNANFGVNNIFIENKPLTQSLTAAFDADLDYERNELYFTEQTDTGVKLKRAQLKEPLKVPISDQNKKMDRPTPVPSLLGDRYRSSTMEQGSLKSTVEDYSISSYLLPRYLLPFFFVDSNSSYISLQTSANDPLQKHLWQFFANYDLAISKFGYNFSYINNATTAQISLTAIDQSLALAGGSTQRNLSGALLGTWDLPHLGKNWTTTWGIVTGSQESGSTFTFQTGVSAQITQQNFSQSGAQISPETGYALSARYVAYPAGYSQTAYNRYDLALTKFTNLFLPKRHALMIKLQGAGIDRNVSTSNYYISYSQVYQPNYPFPYFAVRGYPTGTFQAKTFAQATLEYRFPLKSVFSGSGTIPLYFKRIYGSLIADGVGIDGFFYNPIPKAYQSTTNTQSFISYGLELKLDTTVGYHFPMTFFAGYYQPADSRYAQNPTFAMGLFL